jgi:hypothetical protein
MASKIQYNMSTIAKKAGISPKGARAKFRRMKKERPFDHTKVTLNAALAAKAVAFLKQDFRNV